MRLIMPWRLPAAPARTLPEAVILNRFLADDLVFILGILLYPNSVKHRRHGMPLHRPGDFKLLNMLGSGLDKAEKPLRCKSAMQERRIRGLDLEGLLSTNPILARQHCDKVMLGKIHSLVLRLVNLHNGIVAEL